MNYDLTSYLSDIELSEEENYTLNKEFTELLNSKIAMVNFVNPAKWDSRNRANWTLVIPFLQLSIPLVINGNLAYGKLDINKAIESAISVINDCLKDDTLLQDYRIKSVWDWQAIFNESDSKLIYRVVNY